MLCKLEEEGEEEKGGREGGKEGGREIRDPQKLYNLKDE